MPADFLAVADASSLIVLAKVNALHTLHAVYGVVAITDTVFREAVLVGQQLGKSDAWIIETALVRGLLTRISLTVEEEVLAQSYHSSNPSLDLGECESIALAESRSVPLIIEDRKAKALAKARDIVYTIVQMVPFWGYIDGKVSCAQCLELMERIAMTMDTDVAVLNGMKAAVEALESERRESKRDV
jgi:predicted nucleic acid-binding protein